MKLHTGIIGKKRTGWDKILVNSHDGHIKHGRYMSNKDTVSYPGDVRELITKHAGVSESLNRISQALEAKVWNEKT
jgi:hypothetical protein